MKNDYADKSHVKKEKPDYALYVLTGMSFAGFAVAFVSWFLP